VRFRLVVDDSNWLLLTGSRFSQVVVNSGLTVQSNLCTTATFGARKKWRYSRGAQIIIRFRLAVAELYRLLLTGGCCSELVIKAGFTVVPLLA
jgi:hypothetical protein